MLNLSPREREVAVLAMKGLGAKAIGDALNLKPSTIGVYLHDIYVKLGLSGPGAGRQLMLRGRELLGAGE